MEIGVVGMTVFGVAFGATTARLGMKTYITDRDEELLNGIQEGELPGYEVNLDKLVAEGLDSGMLVTKARLREVVKAVEVIFITCEVPAEEKVEDSLRFVLDIVRSIAATMEEDKLVIVRTPVPPGGTAIIRAAADQVLADEDKACQMEIVLSPDFSRPGTMLKDINRPKFVAIGADSEAAGDKVRALYTGDGGLVASKLIFGTTVDVELAAYGLSAMLAIKMAFVNELAYLSHVYDANIETVTKIIGKDPRVSPQIMDPNPGLSGSFIPKGTRTLINLAADMETDLAVLEGALASNLRHQERLVAKIDEFMGGLEGKVIAISGVTLDYGTDDLRESPVIGILKALVAGGATLQIFAGACEGQVKWRLHQEQGSFTLVENVYEAAQDADGLIVVTRWPNTRSVDENEVRNRMKGDVLIDMQNLFASRKEVQRLFDYHGIGM